MQEFILGQVGIVPKGEYLSSATYIPLNTVTSGGGTWICIKQCTGIKPGVSGSWRTYWQTFANGVSSITVANGTAGNVNMTINYTDGTTGSFTFSSSALAANSVGTTELKENAVTNEKILDDTIGSSKLSAEAKEKFAPAYSFGTEDKVPGSPSTEPENSIYWVIPE